MKDKNKKSGRNLRAIRKAKGFTQKSFGLKAKVSFADDDNAKQIIYNYEKGLRSFDKYIDSFARILNVRIEYLLGNSDMLIDSPRFRLEVKENEDMIQHAYYLINYLENIGYKIKFHYIKIFNPIDSEDIQEILFTKLKDVKEQTTSFSNLRFFSLGTPKCFVIEDDTISEAVIPHITINESCLTFFQFVFYVITSQWAMYENFNNSIASLPELTNSYFNDAEDIKAFADKMEWADKNILFGEILGGDVLSRYAYSSQLEYNEDGSITKTIRESEKEILLKILTTDIAIPTYYDIIDRQVNGKWVHFKLPHHNFNNIKLKINRDDFNNL